MINTQIRIQTKTLLSIHRDIPNTIHCIHVSGHHTRTPWTIFESTEWQDQRLKHIYPASGYMHMLEPGGVIRCKHWAWGSTGTIPHVTNNTLDHSAKPPLPRCTLQSRTDTWNTRVTHQTLRASPLTTLSLLVTVASLVFHSTCPHNSYMYK